jgi:hypothetical protein
MFEVIIQFFMQDSQRVTTDDPSLVLSALNLRAVSHVEIVSLR